MRQYVHVQLPEPPYSVNFELTLPEGDEGSGIETLVDGRIVVPVLARDAQEHKLSSLYAAMAGMPKIVHLYAPSVTLAFAITDFKVQGRTLGELILSISPRPFPPHLCLRGLYVFVSRVRKRCRLKLLHRASDKDGGLKYLFKLQHVPELAIWDKGYNDKGDWVVQLALNAAQEANAAVTAFQHREAR